MARLGREVAVSLDELRDVARGIHPAVVTGHGLGVALESIAERTPLPLELTVADLPRLPEPIEVAAYFLVAESLTNVAKYANATHATVRLAQENGDLAIEVRDDGRGGATATPGSGLAGLQDRVGALDGVLEVSSPPGEGTVLRAVLPL